jgi:methionyl-tRNA formyltransferase
MRVLLLTPLPHYLADAITTAGDSYDVSMEPPERWVGDVDFVVSFGYRHIISARYINALHGRLINIHISLLPWNRGADPNFWSWFDRTPKGVTIHAIDAGVDTGDVLAQFDAGIMLRR